jgi:protein-tyrosine kinase
VSVIETTLYKLRRAGEADAHLGVLQPEPVVAAAAPRESAVRVAAVPGPAPEAEERARHITIDLGALRAAGYLPAEGLEGRFRDHYRRIKRPLIEKALAGSADMRLIMVSSALPGDGKTFTSINLALSMARERDATVLLVDADAPRARISEVLGLRGKPGLLDALVDQSVDVESLVEGTSVRGLEILPAGAFLENATELLASARMRQIVARLCARNPRRLILFDCAPLLVSSEARVVMRIPGQLVLVVRAGVTPLRAVTEALAQIDKTKVQGLVLNQAPFRDRGSYYYGYGFGAGGGTAVADG